MKSNLQNIAILSNTLYRDLQISLAERLIREHGSRIHLYVRGHLAIQYFEKNAPKDLFSTITVNPHAHPLVFPENLDEDEVVEKAQKFEDRYGRLYNSFAVDDRHFGRGFAPGGFHHPRSRQSETSSYVQFLNAYNEFFEFWETQLAEKAIDLIIDGGLREESVARANGAICRRPSPARLENRYFWSTDQFSYSSIFEEEFRKQSDPTNVAIVEQMPFAQKAVNDMALRHQKFGAMLMRCVRQVKSHAYYHYKRSEKAKRYYLTSELSFIYRVWRDSKMVLKNHTGRLAELEGRKFVYYPLHVEPELALQARSPEYFFQLTAIISIARDLPAGVVLAVKEHIPAIGRRPERFYEQINELKNVILMNPGESGLEIIQQADMVVVITGTAGQEAAVRGTPVISFGRHNLYNVLPHVFVVTDDARIPEYLARGLDPNFDRAAAVTHGRRYLAALRDVSFSLEEMNHINTDGFSDAAVEAAYSQLMRTIDTIDRDRAAEA
jgi:hypothetical protein